LRNRPARHRVPLPVANVGHSRITLPDGVTFRGSPKTRIGRIGGLDEWPAPLRGLGAARRRNLGPGEDFE